MNPGISFTTLLAHTDTGMRVGSDGSQPNTVALDLPCDVAGAGTVRKL